MEGSGTAFHATCGFFFGLGLGWCHLAYSPGLEQGGAAPSKFVTKLTENSSDGHERADEIRLQVREEERGLRVDVFLLRRGVVASRKLARALVEAGQVQVDGRATKAGRALEPGQRVSADPNLETVGPEDSTAACVAAEPRLLHEDPQILVIDKPPGLVAHPPAGRPLGLDSVAGWAVQRDPELPRVAGEDRPGIVHRLDKETSGVMVLARTEDALHFLKGEFRERRVEKEYRALAYGRARFASDYIERQIATHPSRGDRMVVVSEGGREASTYYEVVERLGDFTHFRCRPKTGRTHQIRVHMMSVGHSLVGDRLYRSRNHSTRSLPEGAPDPGRHCLHARCLAFVHPFTRERVEFEAPLPEDMAVLAEFLRAQAD